MTRAPHSELPGGLPLRVSLLAGLPIALCMGVLALPELGHAYAGLFRAFYAACYLVWIVPLALLQRAMWRRAVPARVSIPVLLVATYVPSAINSALALAAAVHWGVARRFDLGKVFMGLDGCWLALIAFCAIHALLFHYDALQRARQRMTQALALAREAELRALQYQLHPHFLFNTLNNISGLVSAGRSADATRMIARLGDLLRATLERSTEAQVSVADELALTEHYLDIEKARLGARLRINLRVGPGVLQAQLPPLLLQPLVENALRHGIALRADGGALDLHIGREGECLVILLRNDGVPPGSDLRAEPSSAIGLNNVRQRLQALYPEAHQLSVTLDSEGSCTVRIALPLHVSQADSSQAQAA